MKQKILTNTLTVALIAMFCCALWGSAFPCIKIGYEMFGIDNSDTVTQILFAGIRFALAGIMVILYGSISEKRFMRPEKREYHRVIILSLFQTIYQYVFFYIGLAHTSGVKASIIIGSNVFIAIFAACFVFRQEKFSVTKLVGCVIGFAGVVIINLAGAGISMEISLFGEGFIFLAATSYAISSALIKKYSNTSNTIMLSGYQFLFGGLVMSVAGVLLGGRIKIVNIEQLLMLTYLALISAVAYSLWTVLLKYNTVSKVSVFGFMNPVWGVVLSAILLNEGQDIFSLSSFVALALVCVGIIIVNLNKNFTC